MDKDRLLNSIDFKIVKHLCEKQCANKKNPAEQVTDKLWMIVSRLIKKDFPTPIVVRNLGLKKIKL